MSRQKYSDDERIYLENQFKISKYPTKEHFKDMSDQLQIANNKLSVKIFKLFIIFFFNFFFCLDLV
jgi:hypothetical protein